MGKKTVKEIFKPSLITYEYFYKILEFQEARSLLHESNALNGAQNVASKWTIHTPFVKRPF